MKNILLYAVLAIVSVACTKPTLDDGGEPPKETKTISFGIDQGWVLSSETSKTGTTFQHISPDTFWIWVENDITGQVAVPASKADFNTTGTWVLEADQHYVARISSLNPGADYDNGFDDRVKPTTHTTLHYSANWHFLVAEGTEDETINIKLEESPYYLLTFTYPNLTYAPGVSIYLPDHNFAFNLWVTNTNVRYAYILEGAWVGETANLRAHVNGGLFNMGDLNYTEKKGNIHYNFDLVD